MGESDFPRAESARRYVSGVEFLLQASEHQLMGIALWVADIASGDEIGKIKCVFR